MVKLWNENTIANDQKLLDYLLSIWLKDGGYPFTAKNTIAYHEFLSSKNNDKLNSLAVNKTLTEMIASSNNSYEDFMNVYSKIVKDLSQKIPVKRKWTFYIPIDAEFENNIIFPIIITILEHKYTFIRNVPFSKKILANFPEKLYEFRGEVTNHITNTNMIFLCVSNISESWYSAWENITLSFDTLRGIIEFSFGFRGFEMSSQSKPRSKIPHPKWLLIQNQSNSFEGTTFNTQDYKLIWKFKFSREHFRIVKNNTRFIQKIPPLNSSKQLLFSCMRLYSDAMDGYYYYNQFLGLWNIAEAICLSDEFGGESKKVAKKLAWFGKNLDLASTGYSNILDSLSHKRNNLVHKGTEEIDEDDINHLKFAIDTALLWLYRALPKLKTISHLSHFYRMRDLGKTELNAINETVSIIKKDR